VRTTKSESGDGLSREQLEKVVEEASRRAAERIAHLREQIEPTVERARENAPQYAERLAERGREAFDQAREVAPEYAERLAERGREAFDQAREVAPEYAEKVAERSRETAERVERYLEEHVDEETLDVWGPRVLAAFVGFVVGVLVGWLIGARGNDDELLSDEEAGRTYSSRDPAARPSTRMPDVAERVEAGGDGQHG
jgi:ElaB/YqjD/DUF883 family membrane-anchored ribosome-binding protein